MTLEEMQEMFEKHNDKFLKSPDGESRRDLDGFNLLHRLAPKKGDIVSAAEHDEFWIATEPEEFAKAATEEDVIFLIQCGIMYDSDYESFHMFA